MCVITCCRSWFISSGVCKTQVWHSSFIHHWFEYTMHACDLPVHDDTRERQSKQHKPDPKAVQLSFKENSELPQVGFGPIISKPF